MQRQGRRDTNPERALRSELHRRGLRFRVQRRVLNNTRRTVDIVFGPSRTVVDVRGCFWHGCPQHATYPKANADWWRQKIAANQARDADTDRRLAEAGWAVVVVWEHENLIAAADRVQAVVETRRPDSPTADDA